MGRKVRIESEDGILTIRTAPIFQPLLAKRFCIILVMAFHLDQLQP
jgi:hypothetical protein